MIRTQQAPSRHARPFHNAKSVYAEHSIDNALQAGQLTADDARLIRDFIAEIKVTGGIGVSRANKLTYILVSWRQVHRAVPNRHRGRPLSGDRGSAGGAARRYGDTL